jgi:hypothetical protein
MVEIIKLGCGFNVIPADATVTIAGKCYRTPNIISISVSRSRGSLVGSASASVHIGEESSGCSGSKGSATSGPTGDVIIKFFGYPVFVGTMKRLSISPSYRCQGEFILRIQAEDAMSNLEGKVYTRRQKLPGLGPLGLITSVYKRTFTGFDNPAELHDISSSASPVKYFTNTVNIAEHTKLLKSGETNVMGDLHPVTKVADKPQKGGGGTGGGIILHDHSSLSLTGPHSGGPAYAVFSSK